MKKVRKEQYPQKIKEANNVIFTIQKGLSL